jgi:hypothetical protein
MGRWVRAAAADFGYPFRFAAPGGHPGVGGMRCAKERTMRRGAGISLILVCGGLDFCGDRPLDCGTDVVMGTLSSMVRDRVLRVAEDAYPATIDAARRTALTKATRVTPRDPTLIEWDQAAGRLACVARVVVDAPGPDPGTNLTIENELRYRVTRDNDTFLVEVAYAEMMSVFPPRPAAVRKVRATR